MATFHEGLWGAEDAQREEQLGALAEQQAHDTYILQQAKDILCRLWLADRIAVESRAAGDSALSAALHAIEWPGLKKIGLVQGQHLSVVQWRKEQERKNEPF